MLDAKQGPAIARICRLVNGLPLAIELAAAWVESLDCATIADEIADQVTSLRRRCGICPHRIAACGQVFEQSWRLLTSDEQCTFRRLAVFRGGAEREAALEVAQTTLPLLQALRGKSLIQVQVEAAGMRYDLHDLIRQYSYEHLQTSGEEYSVRNAHLAYYIQLAETADDKLRGAEQAVMLRQLEVEHDNLRAAFEWSIASQNRTAGLRLAAALGQFREIRGYWREGRANLERTLAVAGGAPAKITARALLRIGMIARLQGDNTAATTWLDQKPCAVPRHG